MPLPHQVMVPFDLVAYDIFKCISNDPNFKLVAVNGDLAHPKNLMVIH